MHELSIAVSLVELAAEQVRLEPGERVTHLHLRLGRQSGVAKDALMFSFDVAAEGSPIEGAALAIDETSGHELQLIAVEVQ